ncbi:MAG: glycosyltransferase family 2 protein [Sphingomonadales bacterium]|nr:MAG: glycosyltransferase family 2 protein [Sphingomonadales bacterium]
MHRSSPVLALVMIARDEARCIVRCLDSARPHVDRMVVLDTGSTDGTAFLAAGCGAEVHHLPWPGDFSAARNHALTLADADWNLILDADEWIVSGGEELRGWCSKPRLGKVCVRSAMDGGATPDSERRNWITRVLPRGVRFEGRVHEQAASKLSRERIDLHVAHDGYLADQMDRKRGRNGPLLVSELKERPGDPYLLYQLAKDAELHGDLVTACTNYGLALARTKKLANWRHALIVRHLHCLSKTGRTDEALALADREMPNYPESPDLFFVLGNLLLEQAVAEPHQAVSDWLPLAAGAWERCLSIGERPDLEGSMQGCGSHLARHNLEAVHTQLALHAARQELEQIAR